MYQIVQMKNEDIPCALEIWHTQFIKFCSNSLFPDFWIGGKATIESYLLEQIEKGNAIVAKMNEIIVGFMAWMYFDFHNERTAFCPIIGHASINENKEKVYLKLYNNSSKKWVQDNRFNHLWMTFFEDINLKNMLYEVGFGSYVMDACQKILPNMFQVDCPYRITKAVSNDADALLKLANETTKYYSDPPIFLKGREFSKDYITRIITQEHAFIAWDNDNMIGVISFSVNQGYHFERLTSVESSYICDIGAYIKPSYRGKGVGASLLKEVFDYCIKIGKPFIHVSYETANPYASKFWPKYFKPVIRSVRRTINKDANEGL
jgi:GNAT superfamily N-acetyltransferase